MVESSKGTIGSIKYGEQTIAFTKINGNTVFPYEKPYSWSIIFYPSNHIQETTSYYGSRSYCGAFNFHNFALLIGGTSDLNEVYLDYGTFGLDASEDNNGKLLNKSLVNKFDSTTKIIDLPMAMYNNGMLLKLDIINTPINVNNTNYIVDSYRWSNDLTLSKNKLNLYTAFCKIKSEYITTNETVSLNCNFTQTTTGQMNSTYSNLLIDNPYGIKLTWYSDNKDLIDDIRGVRFIGGTLSKTGINSWTNTNSIGSYIYVDYINKFFSKLTCGCLMGIKNEDLWSHWDRVLKTRRYIIECGKKDKVNLDNITNTDDQWEASITLGNLPTAYAATYPTINKFKHTLYRDGTYLNETI